MLARYMPSSCVCLCLSVTLQYCIKTAKRSITQIMSHDITPGISFSDAKDHGEIRTGSPPTGRQMQVRWVNLATFDEKRAITRKRYKMDA